MFNYCTEYEPMDISSEKQQMLLKTQKKELLESLHSHLKGEKVLEHHIDQLLNMGILKKKIDPLRNENFTQNTNAEKTITGSGYNGQSIAQAKFDYYEEEKKKLAEFYEQTHKEKLRKKKQRKDNMIRKAETIKIFFRR